jgi:hypothetical protein
MARQIATVQNKTANSADAGGRLTIFQSRSFLATKGGPCVVLLPNHRDRSGLIAVMNSAMAPPFVVVLPVKLAAGKVRSVWRAR